MKQTLITLAVALCCGFAGSAVAAGAGMSKADYKAQKDRITADYKVAKQKCDNSSGNAKDVCKKDAKAAYITAKADAKATKVGEEKGPNSAAAMGARKDATNDTNAAQYTAAKERCDAAFANRAMSGPEKDNCISDAKKKFGKM